MIQVAFVRGAFLNNFEGQCYNFHDEINLTGISSLKPLHSHFPFETIKLPSLTDVPVYPKLVSYISNRTLGDAHILVGLEKFADRFDIFHTADPYYYYSYQLAQLRAQGKIKKLIVTSWETIPFNNETVARKKEIKQFTLRNADYFICYTEKAKNVLMKEGVEAYNISVIPLGIDIECFKPDKKKEKDSINILFTGRLVEEKGILDLYSVFKKVQKPGNVRLTIIGMGYLLRELQERIANDNVEEYVTIKQVPYEDMPEEYRNADIFVLPSKKTKTWEEQYGMVLVEAMASGLPIIAYNTGAIPEVISDAGILVKEGDVSELTNQLTSLINSHDLRITMSKKARKRAEEYFNRERSMEKIKKMYRKVYNT